MGVLLKQSIHDLLLLLHVLLALFESVTLALDVNDSAVMEHPVKDSGSDCDISENLIPLGKGLV